MKQNIVGFAVLLIITLGCSLSQALPASELTPTANIQQMPQVAAAGPTVTIAATELPTVIPLPSMIITHAPNLPRTAISIGALPSPTVYNNAQPQIATAYVGCTSTIASGTVATNSAPYIKMNVMLASDFAHPLADLSLIPNNV